MTNVNFVRVQYENIAGAQVHQGFYAAYSSVAPQVNSAVSALLNQFPTASILVTGHSLGGALATFAAVEMKTKMNVSRKMTFYTFGSPRTGNQAWTDYIFRQFST